VGGAIVILFVMFVAGPIGVFAVGAVWSALNGWLQSAAADARAEASAASGAS
jgi:hypothetical protein